MIRRTIQWFFALAILGSLANGVSAQAPAKPLPGEIGHVYLGGGQTLAAMEPWMLTKDAHATKFLCAPTGTRVAYISEKETSQGAHQTVGVATIRSGDTTTYYSCGISADTGRRANSSMINDLEGWSDDAAYLAFDTIGYSSNSESGRVIDRLQCIDLVHGSVFPIPLPLGRLPASANQGGNMSLPVGTVILSGVSWAPGRRLLAFGIAIILPKKQLEHYLCLFDPERRSTRILYSEGSPSKHLLICEGWLDGGHIAYGQGPNQFVYDLAADKLSASTPGPPKDLARSFDNGTEVTDLLPNKASLTLSETQPEGEDQNKDAGRETSLWITRTGGAPKPSKLLLDTFLTGDDSDDDSNSEPRFAPNGGFGRKGVYRVVYMSEGDLKIVDLSPRASTPEEKLAGGDKLTCEEEIDIASSDARQIGLGIMQYAADNNQTFPAAGGFHDSIYPYIRNDSVFTSPNGEAFHYEAPADLNMKDVSDDEDTPLGEFSLPCADVVLMADGHVKVKQKVTPNP